MTALGIPGLVSCGLLPARRLSSRILDKLSTTPSQENFWAGDGPFFGRTMNSLEHFNAVAECVDWCARQKGMPGLNPKVRLLVGMLNHEGFDTTLSGDLESDMVVYVDLADEYEEMLARTALPRLWRVVPTSVDGAFLALFACTPPNTGKVVNPVRTRLIRMGSHPVTEEEAASLLRALQRAANPAIGGYCYEKGEAGQAA